MLVVQGPSAADPTTPTMYVDGHSLGGFEILEHTADVGITARGSTLAEALSWVARGMFSVIADPDGIEPRQHRELTVSSTDVQALVVDWLNELLYHFEAERFLPGEFSISTDDSGAGLVARCTGETVDPERHVMRTDVKAATYHGLEVSHDGEWSITVVLDI